MTQEEAKQIIADWLASSKGEKGQCGYIEGWFYEKDVEAFRMAIEALEQEAKCGEWLEIIDTNEYGELCIVGVYCSECGTTSSVECNFCPDCGARMERGNL